MSKEKVRAGDMTVGSPLKIIFLFTIPLLIGNVFQKAYNIVDTMVVGYTLGDNAIAAIGATAALWRMVINFAFGMNNGCAIEITRYFGANNIRQIKKSVASTMIINAGVCITLTTFTTVFLKPLLSFLNTPEKIYQQAYTYIFILCCGMVTTVAYNMFSAILRSFGNSKVSLYFLILSTLCNVLLDVLFVAVFKLGIVGVACATVLAQLLSAILCGLYTFKKYYEYMPALSDFRVSRSLLWEVFTSGFAMALMYCVVDFGSVIFQSANNVLGEVYIAAFSAAKTWIDIIMSPASMISTAFATFVGQNRGAGKFDRIRNTLKSILIVEILYGFFSCFIAYVAGPALVAFSTGSHDETLIYNAALSLRIHLPLSPALGVLIVLRSMMQSMGQKILPVISSSMELGMKILSAAIFIPHWGYVGTCITEPITWFLCMVYLIICYFVSCRKHLASGDGVNGTLTVPFGSQNMK